jgi:splicing factor 3A subunit 3
MVRSDGLQSVQVDENEEAVVIDRAYYSALCPRRAADWICVALDSVFSGEEAYGRYLDLYQPHSQYLNLRGANR